MGDGRVGGRGRRERPPHALGRAGQRQLTVTPRWATASTMALYTAGSAPIVPDSPTPLAPSGLTHVGVSRWCTSNDGSSAAEMTG